MKVDKHDGKVGLIELATSKEIRVSGVNALEIVAAQERTGIVVYMLASDIDKKVAKQTERLRAEAIAEATKPAPKSPKPKPEPADDEL